MICKHDIKEIIIIGAGPAGITAAIYAARKKKCVWMFYETLAGQASLTDNIENYAGFKMVSGNEFSKKLKEHLDEYDLQPREEKVFEVKKKGKLFFVRTNKAIYKSKAVIIASGARHKNLNVPGEKDFIGKGVAYCAICDAPLFNNKDVAVIGGGNTALTTALELDKYARKIYLITINEEMHGEETLISKVKASSKIEFICCSKISAIKGDKFVKSIEIEDKKGARIIDVKGVFVGIGYIPNSEIADVNKNKNNEIIIDGKNETSVKGLFAAGDVSAVTVKQIIVASGEGAKAALYASDYVEKFNKM